MNGDQLTTSLVSHLRSRSKPPIVLTELGLSGTWGRDGRLDVVALTIPPNYGALQVAGYEVKASRKDLFVDLDAGKFRKYLDACSSFFFALPAGLATKDELPDDVGLVVATPGGRWQTVRRSPQLKGTPDHPGVLRIIRRLDSLREEASRRDTKLDRLHRMAEAADERRLRYYLSAKAQSEIREAERKTHYLDDRLAELEEKRKALEGADEVLRDLELVGLAFSRLANLAVDSVSGTGYRSRHRDEARAKLRKSVDAAVKLGLISEAQAGPTR